MIPDNLSIPAIFPNFSADFEQIAWFDASLSTPTEARYQHFVNDPAFNDFDTLQYGQGYQLYCENPNGVTITLTGKLPTTPTTTNLLPGWHLLPTITTDEPKPLSWLLSGVSYDTVSVFNATTQHLEPATELHPGDAAFVHVTTTSSFTPPLPREVTTHFVYDGGGGRVKKITASGTTRYLGEAYEITPTGTTTTYIYAGSLRLAATDSTGALRFYHPDHLGSSHVITDAQGHLVELNEHAPYGTITRHEGSTDVAQKFTGQRFDAETRLAFYQARYYDPMLGRFLSPDPLVQDPADPQCLNRYSYVRNNPTNLVDPSGYRSFWRRFFHRVAQVATVVAVVATVVAVGALVVGHPEVAAAAFAVAKGAAVVAAAATAIAAAIPDKSPHLSDVSGQVLDVHSGQVIHDPLTAVNEHGVGRLPLHVNGINTGPQQAREQALSRRALVVFYDPTAGVVADIYDRGFRKFLGPTEIDKQLQRTLDRLTEAGVPVKLTAFSGGPIAVTRAAEEGARLAPGSAVKFFSAGVGRQRADAAVTAAGGKLSFVPTDPFDWINIAQDFNLKTFGGVIGGVSDLLTGGKFTAHRLPSVDEYP